MERDAAGGGMKERMSGDGGRVKKKTVFLQNRPSGEMELH